jgi:hypothetical protein
MKNQEFHSFKVSRSDISKEEKGIRFHLPKEYLEQLTETTQSLKRIETLLESFVLPQTVLKEVTPTVSVKKALKPNIAVPFLSLKLTSSPDFYKVSRTFIPDLELGKTNFGFQKINTNLSEGFLFVFASFISYSKDNIPVLVIVEDLNRPEWKNIKGNLTTGSIGGCLCYDWGNVTIVERKEILKVKSSEYKELYSCFNEEFKAIFWSISENGIHDDYEGFSYFVLDSLNSITIVLSKEKGKISDVMKVKKFYGEYKIPIKGLLNGQ